ncbi:hypothetical protein V502_02568 [Pseudogymnoascus sp. VKM F-4520 (FW-2644)]|nr:hypothetical protein V502_02568 [Pseudogymnoascus sp. VKM F-4520 (FW-2644)]
MGVILTTTVVTSSEQRGRLKSKQPGSWEWVTVIQGVGALGWALPLFVVVKGKFHLRLWYKDGQLPKTWKVYPSENGWTTNEITLDWVKHFNQYTRLQTIGVYRLLILDGHESHYSIAFEEYCKNNSIITLCMPLHSSHLLQPLDVGCFSPLKKAYGTQIEMLMRGGQTYITKDNFLRAFRTAFEVAITEKNIKGGFCGAGLLLFNVGVVTGLLDLQLKTPTPLSLRPGTS